MSTSTEPQQLLNQVIVQTTESTCPDAFCEQDTNENEIVDEDSKLAQTRNTNSRDRHISSVLQDFYSQMEERTANHLGYPYNLDFQYAAVQNFMKFSINNLGDPFVDSNYGINSRQFEIEVLNFFAKLYEIDENDYWGYVTSCGTEGNLHGLLVGRECHPTGVLYSSKDSHYSILKAARFFRIPFVSINSQANGEIDYDDLEANLIKNKDLPAIINVNIGTTVKGAFDNLDRVFEILDRLGKTDFYIHCDGALSGLMLPLIDDAMKVTFKKRIGSVSISAHKFMGCPFPAGIVVTRKSHIAKVQQDIEYIGSKDSTLSGSRNGHAPLYMWLNIRKKQRFGFKKDVEECLKKARIFADMLTSAGIQRVMLNRWSNTVVFEKPADYAFCRKYQLATTQDIAHVIVMQNVSIDKLQEFVDEFVKLKASLKAQQN